MSILRDTLSRSLYVLVGLTRLHGLDSEPSSYGLFGFVILATALSVLALGLVRRPVPRSVPALLFLLLQIVTVSKEYEEAGRATESPAVVLATSILGLVLYAVFRGVDTRGTDDDSELAKDTSEGYA